MSISVRIVDTGAESSAILELDVSQAGQLINHFLIDSVVVSWQFNEYDGNSQVKSNEIKFIYTWKCSQVAETNI